MRGVLRCVVMLIAGFGMLLPLSATTIVPLDLADLSFRAESIVHGTVLSAEPGTVQVGGGILPTITYEVRVLEGFKGDFVTKGDSQVLEITMIGDLKGNAETGGPIRKLSSVEGLPRLTVGDQYLLFTTQPSQVGLSTTVGLGTGCFHISGDGDKAVVINGYDNAGVFQGLSGMPSSGPVSYAALVEQLRNILGQ